MKKANVLLMTWNEFNDLVGTVSNGEAGIANESGEWFYISTEEYWIDDINKDLSYHLGEKVKNVLIDLSEDEDNCVVIVLE